MKPSRQALKDAGGRTKDGRSLPPSSIYIIGVDTAHGPAHELYSADAVELARTGEYDPLWVRNIRELGVLQPVRVRLEEVGRDDEAWPSGCRGHLVHVCVVGRHRVLTARRVAADLLAEGVIATLEQWQVDVVLDTRGGKSVETVIAENRYRRTLSAIETGTQVAQMLAVGYTMDALPEVFKRSEGHLRSFHTLAERGTAELHGALRSGRITDTDACKVAKLEPEEQRKVVSELPADGRAKGGKVAALMASAKGQSVPVRPPSRSAVQRAATRASAGDVSTWTERERELLAIAAGLKSLEDASEEIRALFA
jgi:ParB-like chromosome segregation protein Spo0J